MHYRRATSPLGSLCSRLGSPDAHLSSASLREIWDGAALFIPPGDIDTLGRTLQTLSQDRSQLAWLAARARTRALQYTPERMLLGYLAAYEQILQARQGCRHNVAADQPAWLEHAPVMDG